MKMQRFFEGKKWLLLIAIGARDEGYPDLEP